MWDFIQNNWISMLLLLAVLACPLMHVFTHRRSGHGHSAHKPGN